MPRAQAQVGDGAVLVITDVSARFLVVAGSICPNKQATP